MAEVYKIPKECVSGSTLCLFFYHADCRGKAYGYSLFGIDVSPGDNEQGFQMNNPRVLVQLVLPKRTDLLCVKCGSKFYFLGGFFGFDDDENNYLDCPPDVLVFDPTDPHNFTRHPSHRLTKVAPMNSGKIYGTAFEVNGKLYVLGGRQPWLYPSDFNDEKYCVFEVYDPAKNRWEKLQGPPLRPGCLDPLNVFYGYGVSCSFVINPRRVLIAGSFPCILTYDAITNSWSKFGLSGHNFGGHDLFLNGNFVGVFDHDTHTVSKIGPCSFPKAGRRLRLQESKVDVEWGSSESNFSIATDRRICHLHDMFFCIIEAITRPVPCFKDNRDRDHHHAKDHHLHCRINLVIIKEFLRDEDSFEVKFMQQAPFEFTTTNGLVLFSGCHVMDAEEAGDKHIETNLEGENTRTHVDFTNIQTNQPEGVDVKHIETNLEGENARTHVDFMSIQTNQPRGGDSLDEVIDHLVKMRLLHKDVIQAMQNAKL